MARTLHMTSQRSLPFVKYLIKSLKFPTSSLGGALKNKNVYHYSLVLHCGDINTFVAYGVTLNFFPKVGWVHNILYNVAFESLSSKFS